MAINLSCLIVTGDPFPEEKLIGLLEPQFCLTEIEYGNSLSSAFKLLLNSNFNLCLIGFTDEEEIQSFFRDMKKLGRDKTCAFVKVVANSSLIPNRIALNQVGFCTAISSELTTIDINSLRNILSKEVIRISEEQRVVDIPKYVELVLKEVDINARKLQRGIKTSYDKVIAGLVRDMMSEESSHKDSFLEKLATESELAASFETVSVEVPDSVLERNLPKLGKTKYEGSSARVWNKLLKRYGDKDSSK